MEWLDKIAPPWWRRRQTTSPSSLLPEAGDYRHHRGGEDNGDAHLKTCWSTTRRSSRSPTAVSTSGPGSQSFTSSLTAAAPSTW